MRIGLISPKGRFISNIPKFIEFWNSSSYLSSYRQNWSGLSTALPVIAALTPSSYSVEIVDENIEDVNFSANYDLVGITAITQQATRAYQIADEFKKRGITTVIGGIHATILPEEAKQHCDSVVIGEAEYLWPLLLKDFNDGTLKQFYKSDRVVDLNDSPIPRYDLIKSKGYSVAWVQTTRGCPHDCEFCAASKVYGRKYRIKEVTRVIEEINIIKNNLGDIRIHFADDNIFVNKKFAVSLLKGISSLKIRWMGQTDISISEDDDILDSIRKSGCVFLFIGFESLSVENLREINKNNWKLQQSKRYASAIQKIQSNGIGIMGAFIFGFDYDDETVFKKTTEFIIDNNLYDAQFTILTPFPGTRIRDKIISENRLLPSLWDDYTAFDINYIPKNISAQGLQKGLVEAYTSINNQAVYAKKMEHFKQIQKKLVKEGKI